MIKRAIIFALESNVDSNPLLNYRPSALLNIADKPIIIHILEYLIQQGISSFDFVLHHFPEQIEKTLSDGLRWGVRIQTHLTKNPDVPFFSIKPMILRSENEEVIIGVANALPKISDFRLEKPFCPIFYNYATEWSGWGLISLNQLKTVASNISFNNLPLEFDNVMTIETEKLIATDSLYALQESNRQFLRNETINLLLTTGMKQVEKDIWLSRSVVLEPGVEIIPPVLIGNNTHIRAGCIIGPEAIIENNCLIDNYTTIENTIVCQNSYVGENLEMVQCIIDRNALINLNLDTHIEIQEEFLISASSPPAIPKIFREMIERFTAFLLFVILSPLYLAFRLFYPLKKELKLRLPSSEQVSNWTFFYLYSFSGFKRFNWLPQLLNVVKGELSYIGSPPRNKEQVLQLHQEWKKLYLKTKPGIINLSEARCGKNASDDEKYASEAFYAIQKSLFLDIKILLAFLRN